MKRYLLLSLVAWSCWSASFAAAQDPAAPATGAAPAAPAAPLVVKLESNDPAVQALLASNPTTPKDQFEITKLLLDLGKPELARAMLVKLIETAAAPEQLVELGRTFGKREVLRVGEAAGLQPEGKPFAEKVVAAMIASDRDPARIAALIQQLQDPSYDARVAAINNLRAGGDAALQALLTGLLDPNRATEHTMLLTALAGFGESAVGPLVALFESGNEPLMLQAVKALSLTEGEVAELELSVAAFRPDLPAAVRQTALAALSKRHGKAPQPNDVAVKLFVQADHLYRAADRAVEAASSHPHWRWSAAEKMPQMKPIRKSLVDVARAARYAAVTATLNQEAVGRQLAMATSLEADFDLHLVYLEPTSDAVLTRWVETHRPTRTDLEATFDLAASLDRSRIAGLCLDMLSKQGTAAELLTSTDGKPTTLVRAATSPDPGIRLTAVNAVLNLKPTQPFVGSSGVAQSMAWAVTAQGFDKTIVVDANATRGRDFAALMALPDRQTLVYSNVQEGLNAAAEIDVHYVIVDRSSLEPSQGDLLSRLRSDYRTARLWVLVLCEPEEVARTRTRWYADPYTLAIVRANDRNQLMSQVAGEPNFGRVVTVPPEARVELAAEMLGRMRELLAAKSPVFNFRPYEPLLLRAGRSHNLAQAAAGALAAFGSAAAQRTLADVASETARPLEVRQAASQAFVESVRRFGTLLTTAEIARQYERYNASETLDKPTQELLAVMLDAVELRAGKLPARAEAKPATPAAPATEPVPAVPAAPSTTPPSPAPPSAPAPAASPAAAAPAPAP